MGKLGELLSHPDEIIPMAAMYLAARRAAVLPHDPNLAFCYSMLNKVSRSFAIVIQQLPEQLRDAVCVFYLVLRALDTVEDDMAIDQAEKVPILLSFHEKTYEKDWSMKCGHGHYVELMEQYPVVCAAFQGLEPQYQEVITDICRRMGAGMAEFIVKEVETVEDYDLYCHYVAGLVGVGLSNLFAGSGLESEEFASLHELSNGMGLFLQKTNIIRDYLEDIMEEPAPRMFWPKEIWGKHGDSLEDFKDPENAEAAVACLNDMIADALRHVDASLDYMQRLRNRPIFRFCAVPQIMAIGTLAACFDNPSVFTGVVKMRRGQTAKIMHDVEDYADLLAHFRAFGQALAAKARAARGKGAESVGRAAERVVAGCSAALADLSRAENARMAAAPRQPLSLPARALLLVAALLYLFLAWRAEGVRRWLGVDSPPAAHKLDYYNQIVASMFLGYSLFAVGTGRRP
ncbi:SQS1 [Auxenochlorella protothecoides x Auxenochlorella symbiontica]